MSNYSGAEKIRITLLSDVARQTGCGKANCNSCKHLEYDEDRCEYEDDEDDFGSICSKYIFGSGYLEDVPVNLLQEKPCWEPDFWDANLDGFEIGTNLTDQLKSEKKFNDFVASMMPTDAYCEYMSMANKLFEHIRNGTTESIEESVKIEKRQAELWEKMTDNEKIDADDTVLRTVIYLKAIREKMKARPKKTTVKRSGKSGFTINFSEKDGKAVADRMRTGGSLAEVLFGKNPYTEEELKKWWLALCPKCGWKGLSRDCNGGNPLADTGDYSDVTCPVCDEIVIDG